MDLQFFGAVGTTTGSMHLLTVGGKRILLECGLYQGRRKEAFERNRQIPAARGKRDRAISEAQGYRERKVKATTGRVNAFLAQLAEYEKSPEVTRTRLYLEAMEEILSAVDSKIVIDESVRGLLPLLNLGADASASGTQKGGAR